MEKNKRKTYHGPINDKTRTKARLIAATGIVLEEYGYTGLTYDKIARKSNYDRALISLYFGGVDGIVEEYLSQKISLMDTVYDKFFTHYAESLPSTVDVLLDVFNLVSKDRQLQKILLWDLSDKEIELTRSARKRKELVHLFHSKIESLLLADVSHDKGHLCLLLSSVLFFSIAQSPEQASIYDLNIWSKSGKNRFIQALGNIENYRMNK